MQSDSPRLWCNRSRLGVAVAVAVAVALVLRLPLPLLLLWLSLQSQARATLNAMLATSWVGGRDLEVLCFLTYLSYLYRLLNWLSSADLSAAGFK